MAVPGTRPRSDVSGFIDCTTSSAMLATTEQPVEKLRLAFASGQRPVIQFLWTKVLHTDELFADLAAARARLVEYVSLAVVTLDDGTKLSLKPASLTADAPPAESLRPDMAAMIGALERAGQYQKAALLRKSMQGGQELT